MGEHLGDLAKIGVDDFDRKALQMDNGVVDGDWIAVEANHLTLIAHGCGDQPGMPAATQCAIDKRLTGRRRQPLKDLVRHDGHVRRFGLFHSCLGYR